MWILVCVDDVLAKQGFTKRRIVLIHRKRFPTPLTRGAPFFSRKAKAWFNEALSQDDGVIIRCGAYRSIFIRGSMFISSLYADNRPIPRLLKKNPFSDRVPKAGFVYDCNLFSRSEKVEFAFFYMYVELDILVNFAVDFNRDRFIE